MSGPPPYHNLTLYTWGTPNGHKASITLEELGVQYKTVAVDIAKNIQKENWFLALNPNGRIPALKDGEMSVFESGAIMLYLTDHYDKDHKVSYPHGSREYHEMVSWLMWQMGGLGPALGQAEHFRAMAGVYSAYGINRYVNEAKRLFDVLESRLNTHDWLAGEKYTISDIASYAWLRSAFLLLDIDVGQWPGLDKWMKRIGERPAVQKGVNVPPSSRTAEETAQQFKSMRDRVDAMKNMDKHDS